MPAPTRRFVPADLRAVVIDDGFWGTRQQINRERTIPHVYAQLAESGRLAAFARDWQPSAAERERAAWGGSTVMFWDSDVAKWVEAAAVSLTCHPDAALAARLAALVEQIVARQEPDGYLNTYFTTIDPAGRWANLRDWHELYCIGHLIEAAVACHQATGDAAFLMAMQRAAALIAEVFGTGPGQRRGYCGHPEIELALIRLWQVSGDARHLALSRYFIDERGRQPHYYDEEARRRGEAPERFWARSYEYNQSHLPVRRQRTVAGHAVRAAYLYSAMADLALIDGDAALFEGCDALWRNLTTTRMYVMGGIGTSRHNEGFTSDYDLPNESAYAETCAAIALVLWAQRMLAAGPDRRYGDVLELALHNAVLSGVALDGTSYFYDNPLASDGDHHRQAWFACPCCPPNLARIIAAVGPLAYASSDDTLAVHLYLASHATLTLRGGAVRVQQQTSYPWDGAITLTVGVVAPLEFTLALRIPGWCEGASLRLNGVGQPLVVHAGYAHLRRTWHDGDQLQLELPMPVTRLYAHPAVRAAAGRVALRRGPLIYCIEQLDHQVPLDTIRLPADAALDAHFDASLLGGVVVITGTADTCRSDDWSDTLYRPTPPHVAATPLRAIPYFAWDNRPSGAMRVWINGHDAR